jgi:hypothetical protein
VNGVEPETLAKGNSKFSRLIKYVATHNVPASKMIRVLRKRNMNDFDTFLVIDCSNDNPLGTVGHGKTEKGGSITLAINHVPEIRKVYKGLDIDPDDRITTIARNFVMQNDHDLHQELLGTSPPLTPILRDEAQFAWYKRWHGIKTQKDRVVKFFANRKDNLYHINCLPSIWEMDKGMMDTRIQLRLKVTGRASATLYERNSPFRWNPKADAWGREITKYQDIPRWPEYLREEYHRVNRALKVKYKKKKNMETKEYEDTEEYHSTLQRAHDRIKTICPTCDDELWAERIGREWILDCHECKIKGPIEIRKITTKVEAIRSENSAFLATSVA